MNRAYFDCFAGISGDMVLGAMLDLGLDPAVLEYELCKLPLEGYRLQVSRVEKCGIQATYFQVILTDPTGEHLADAEFQEVEQPAEIHHAQHAHPHRSLTEIIRLIQDSHLSAAVKSTACQIFTRLGQAEARVHGVSLEQVHFHEVGGIDAIVDIVGTAIGLDQLGLTQIYASPLHLGSGFVRCAHGLFPVPAPATANLIAGVPVYSSAVKGELVTPTGAAIITSLAQQFGPLPAMVIQATGYGAGSRDREIPNTLRVYLGQAETSSAYPLLSWENQIRSQGYPVICD